MSAPERRALFWEKWKLLFVCKPWVVSIVNFFLHREDQLWQMTCAMTGDQSET